MRFPGKIFGLLLSLAAASLLFGCGKGRTITMAGSDTVIPLAQRLVDAYMRDNPEASIRVGDGGSTVGINRLKGASVDICLASRKITQEEAEAVKARWGSEVRQTIVARDGIAVYVNERNPLDDISLSQVRAIYTGQAASWRQVGGQVDPVVAFGRDANSGTREILQVAALEGEEYASGVQPVRDTSAMITAVAKDTRAVGYGSMVFAKGVRILRVSRRSGERGIEPSQATVASGKYPLSRDLYFYTVGEATGETAKFLSWVISSEGQKVVREAGFVPVGTIR